MVGPAADELRVNFGAYTSGAHVETPLGMTAVTEVRVPGIAPAAFDFTDLFQTRMPGMYGNFERLARVLHPDVVTVGETVRALDVGTKFVSLGSVEKDGLLYVECVRGALLTASGKPLDRC
ncbi:hypothetical protein ABZ490_23755 [Streptomyces sp. NPDC005811]|uniref:hypothetical protein n=1 Tax=Streptomyces sp. NPDC005811 TaxID=3154565 RepID=UPI0033E8E9FC